MATQEKYLSSQSAQKMGLGDMAQRVVEVQVGESIRWCDLRQIVLRKELFKGTSFICATNAEDYLARSMSGCLNLCVSKHEIATVIFARTFVGTS